MKIGDKNWMEKAKKASRKILCTYCRNAPIYRPFPGGLRICRICDMKLDMLKNKETKWQYQKY